MRIVMPTPLHNSDADMRSTPMLGVGPEQIWYVPSPKLRSKATELETRAIVEWIKTGWGLDRDPDGQALFVALHTCAFRATPRSSRKPVSPRVRSLWVRRWQVVREYIVEQNLGLVYSMISRFNSAHLDDDDLLSDGMFGLARAVDRFNPWKGFKFSTYACNVIARSLMRRGKQTTHYRKKFPVQYDVELEQPTGLPDTQTELYVERLNRALDDNLGELTDLESKILAQRFLNDHGPRRTFREIGDAVGLSKERVRQIQNIAHNKLRDVLDEDPLLQ